MISPSMPPLMKRVKRGTMHVTRRTSHVTRHTSHVTRHTSPAQHTAASDGGQRRGACVTTGQACKTVHITHHTSHVTRHTSHVTRHTSHVRSYPHCDRAGYAQALRRMQAAQQCHKSQVTLHTSHVTRSTCLNARRRPNDNTSIHPCIAV